MAVTQKAIADHLGIARSVVAEALSGHPRIAEHTRERVRRAAHELGYDQTTNREARALIGKRYNRRANSGIVSVLSPASGGPFTEEAAAYYRPLMDGATTMAHECGVSLLLGSHSATSVPNVVTDGTVDGVILFGIVDAVIVERLSKLTVPVVSVGIDPMWDTVITIRPDDQDGGRQAAQHLVDLGHRDFAYLGHRVDRPDDDPRLRGFRRELANSGVRMDVSAIESSLFQVTQDFVSAAVERLLERTCGFTALFCHNDTMAMFAVRALRDRGWGVPEEVSVVGFDDMSTSIGFSPAITSIRSPRFEMGRRAVEIIMATPRVLPSNEIFPVKLIARESSAKIRTASDSLDTVSPS